MTPALRRALTLVAVLCVVAGSFSRAIAADEGGSPLAAGDAAWRARAETMSEGLAAPARIDEAIGHYRAEVANDGGSMEARWKLMRALHYSIDFTQLDEAAKNDRAEAIVALAGESIEALESADAVTDADRARVLFWSSIAWGTRAQRVGLLTIVREGVAVRMHDYARQSLDLDPTVDDGGALRLLSRLHATLPRVPFVSMWVDRDEALPLAERGYALDPDHPGNRLILALALEDGDSDDDERIRTLLESVASATPREDYRAEDEAIRKQAREKLAERSES